MMEWEPIVKTLAATVASGVASGGAIWKYLDYRKERQKEDRNSLNEREKLALEAKKAEDAADTELIKLLMQDKATDRARIQKLEDDVNRERVRCDGELQKLRESMETRIANTDQFHTAQIEQLRAEIRNLIGEVSDLRALNATLKRQMDRGGG